MKKFLRKIIGAIVRIGLDELRDQVRAGVDRRARERADWRRGAVVPLAPPADGSHHPLPPSDDS